LEPEDRGELRDEPDSAEIGYVLVQFGFKLVTKIEYLKKIMQSN